MAETSRKIAVGAGAATAVGAGAAGVAEVRRRRHNARVLGGRSLPSRGRIEAKAKLSATHKAALTQYSGYTYGQVNTFLRSGKLTEVDPKTGKLVASGLFADEITGQARVLKDAFANAKASDGVLFRGVGLSNTGELEVGRVISDKAVASTSTSAAEAARFHDHARKSGKKAAMLVVDAKGASAIDMKGLSKFANEAEVALAPDTKLRVDHVAHGVKRHLFDKPRSYAFASVADDVAAPATKAATKAAVSGGAKIASRVLTRVASKALPVLGAGLAIGVGMSVASEARAAGASQAEAAASGAVAGLDDFFLMGMGSFAVENIGRKRAPGTSAGGHSRGAAKRKKAAELAMAKRKQDQHPGAYLTTAARDKAASQSDPPAAKGAPAKSGRKASAKVSYQTADGRTIQGTTGQIARWLAQKG